MIETVNNDRWIAVKPTKSRKAMLIFDEVGNTYIIPRSKVISMFKDPDRPAWKISHANWVFQTDIKRFESQYTKDNGWNKELLAKSGVDPLTYEENKKREKDSVKVGGDW